MILPPFAEEMNQARHFHALVATALGTLGIDAFQIDLSMTGDSSGEFRDADVALWRDDLHVALDWLAARSGQVDVFALRSAALLVPLLDLPSTGVQSRICLLEPSMDGDRMLSEFLRIKVARSLFEGERVSVDNLRERLTDGTLVDVSGYELSPGLFEQVRQLALEPRNITSQAAVRVLGGRRFMEDWRRRGAGESFNAGRAQYAETILDAEQMWTNDGPEPAAPMAELVARCLADA